eukprot:354317-Chlamydomonas_euryale.AAC.2
MPLTCQLPRPRKLPQFTSQRPHASSYLMHAASFTPTASHRCLSHADCLIHTICLTPVPQPRQLPRASSYPTHAACRSRKRLGVASASRPSPRPRCAPDWHFCSAASGVRAGFVLHAFGKPPDAKQYQSENNRPVLHEP